MKIESLVVYADPLDLVIPSTFDEDPIYESLDDITRSHGSISNILGSSGKPPVKAPTPMLKRRPLAERSNLPPLHSGIFDGKLSHAQKNRCPRTLKKSRIFFFHPNLTKLGCPLGIYLRTNHAKKI